jgi:WD40 repeat protein
MTLIASASDSIKIWSWETNEKELNLKSTYRTNATDFHCLSWNHTNQVVAVGGKEPKVHLIQAINGQALSLLPLSESKLSTVKVQSVSFSNNSRYLVTSLGTPIQLWDLKKRQIKAIFSGHQAPIASLQFNPIGDFYAADESGVIKLWSSKSQTALTEINTPEFSTTIPLGTDIQLTKLAVSPINSSRIAAGYSHGALNVWDLETNITTPFCAVHYHKAKITDVSFSPKNIRLVATCSTDEYVQLIDLGAFGRHLCSTIYLQQPATSLSFHEDGMHCAIGTTEGYIYIYDWRQSSEPVSVTHAHNPFPVLALSFQSIKPTPTTTTSTGAGVGAAGSSSSSLATSMIDMTNTLRPSEPVSLATNHSTSSNNLNDNYLSMKHTNSYSSPSSASPHAHRYQTNNNTTPTNNNNNNNNNNNKTKLNFPSLNDSRESLEAIPYHRPLTTTTNSNSPHHTMKKSSYDPTNQTNPNQDDFVSMSNKVRNLSTNAHEKRNYSESLSTSQIPPPPPPAVDHYHHTSTTAAAASATEENELDNTSKPLEKTFENDYDGRIKAYLEIGQDRIAMKQRENDENIQKSMYHHPLHSSYATAATADDEEAAGGETADEFAVLKQSLRPVTQRDLDEAIELLKYDIHQEVQEIIREQVRQFSIAKVSHFNSSIYFMRVCFLIDNLFLVFYDIFVFLFFSLSCYCTCLVDLFLSYSLSIVSAKLLLIL